MYTDHDTWHVETPKGTLEARAIVKALEEMGLPEIWAKVCLALKEMYEEERSEPA